MAQIAMHKSKAEQSQYNLFVVIFSEINAHMLQSRAAAAAAAASERDGRVCERR